MCPLLKKPGWAPQCTCHIGTFATYSIYIQSMYVVHSCTECIVRMVLIMCRTSGTRKRNASEKEQDKLSVSQKDSVTTDGLQDNKNQKLPCEQCVPAFVCVCVCVAPAHSRAMWLATCCMPSKIPQLGFLTTYTRRPSHYDTRTHTHTYTVHLHCTYTYK